MEKYHKVDADELKMIQLEILDKVAVFCEKNSIKYWIDCGTMLGAIRHKGYIPWDDDIDVGMLREDYDKFSKLFNNTNSKYRFSSVEVDPTFPFPFGKVIDSTTILYEPDRRCGAKYSINIDIFPYDKAPQNKFLLKLMYFKRDVYKSLRLAQMRILKPNGSILKKFAIILTIGFSSLFPENYFCKKVISNSKKYSDSKSNYIGDFTSTGRFCCDKSIFDSFIDVRFEGNNYKIPSRYDEWLKAFYGDYMKLPPEKERVSRHIFEAYSLN